MFLLTGWFDTENLFGALNSYAAKETQSPGVDNTLVMGPWYHGGWGSSRGDSLGEIGWGSATSVFYTDSIEGPFFDHWLKGAPDPGLPEAYVFDTGAVDGAVNGVGSLFQRLARTVRRLQTGLVRTYALAFLIGALVPVRLRGVALVTPWLTATTFLSLLGVAALLVWRRVPDDAARGVALAASIAAFVASLGMLGRFGPALRPQEATQLTVAAATAVRRAVHQQTGLPAEIKWPNDILVHGRKTAGILTELSAELDHVKYLILGIGVDVNQTANEFPADLRKTATSLRIEWDRPVLRPELAAAILRELDRDYARVCAGQFADVADEWEEHCTTIGKHVTVHIGERRVRGDAESLDEDGALLLRTEHGHGADRAEQR